MMNILMCGNDRVYEGMELVIYSTTYHNKNINWYIFTMDIEIMNSNTGEKKAFHGLNEWHRNKLRRIVHYLDNNSSIVFIDVEKLYKQEFWKNPNEFSWLTPYAPMRTCADIALPELDHLLYMDCDIAVCGNIEDMYRNYLRNDYDYAAYVASTGVLEHGEMISGIMLMNLKRIRQTGFLTKARSNIRNNLYQWYDQNGIEDAGRPLPLPETYSYIEDFDTRNFDPIIYHFTNNMKPKIYGEQMPRHMFFRKFPFLKYVYDGCSMLDRIDTIKCEYTIETEPPLLEPAGVKPDYIDPMPREEINNEQYNHYY